MAEKPLYRSVLKEAWHITWRNKFLWIFGFFAALIGNGGEAEVLFRHYTNITSSTEELFSLQDIYRQGVINTVLTNARDVLSTYPFQGLLLLFAALAIAIMLIWLVIISLGAIIDSANKIKTTQKTSLDIAYKAGSHYFGPLLGLNVMGKIVIWGLYLVVSLPLFTLFLVKNDLAGALLYTLFAFVILIPLSVVVSFIIKYAAAFVIIKGRTVWEALKDGWKLFIRNWLVSIEMAVIILLIGLVAGLGLILAAAIISIPFILLGAISLYLAAQLGFVAIVVVGLFVIAFMLALFGAAFATFQYSAWTLLFLQLVEERGTSKIVRVLTQAAGYFSKK